MPKSIPVDWIKHLPRDKQAKCEETLRASQTLVERLIEIVQEWETDLNKQETSGDDYTTPAWSHKQADRNGQRRTLKKLIDLLLPLKA
jgi:hypothetical protein